MRDILDKQKDIKNLVFDTTGIGYFEVGKNVPELADLNAALEKGRSGGVTISRLTEVEMPKEDCIYEVSVSGLG
ncbi:MAG TPA: hypothetical protein VFZ65_10335 [Planctomycetota bacterium]|nr:hypothetical protein [Planctomycetota bacterium]